MRKVRCIDRKKNFSNNTEFHKADKRDQKENEAFGQQVKECNYLSDIIIINNTNFSSASKHSKKDFIDGIHRDYIEKILNAASDEISPEISPSVDELCMTLAYACSKKSSCLKRKVGAVIVDIDSVDIDEKDKHTSINEIPFIISSGFNEVPLLSTKCALDPTYQKCYRDYVKEKHAEKITHCPFCGEEIVYSATCQCGKVYDKYTCQCTECHQDIEWPNCVCGKNVYKEMLAGGKLLDICRALHAEERAILHLAKSGYTSSNLVLYTTTYPCNLCANKIVTAGIKKVVYAEPYTMEEAKQIFDRAGVDVRPFQGIKSFAYFKLYM